MSAIVALARKDLTLLLRNRGARFFILVWPIMTSVLFGVVFSGGGEGGAKPPVAISDLDRTAASMQFVADLKAIDALAIDAQEPNAARELVRAGKRTAAIVLPKGFAESHPPAAQLVIDPSRRAEQAMVEGVLHRAALARTLDVALLAVTRENVARQRNRPANAFAITFPQGMLWGIVGCMMSFATALVLEQMQGTLVRLRASPMTARGILFGKGLACGVSILALVGGLTVVAVSVFGVRPDSFALLALAALAAALCFTGIMMLIASLGSTVQTVSGAGWAIMMPLMLFGGGMIPLFAMPAWMRGFGSISPVKWAIVAFEGAVWRGFSFVEMLQPLAILVGVGVAGCVLGTRRLALRAA